MKKSNINHLIIKNQKIFQKKLRNNRIKILKFNKKNKLKIQMLNNKLIKRKINKMKILKNKKNKQLLKWH